MSNKKYARRIKRNQERNGLKNGEYVETKEEKMKEAIVDDLFIFDCDEIKSNLLKELNVTPESLNRFVKTGWEEFFSSGSLSNGFLEKVRRDTTGMDYRKESVLDVINYYSWTKEKRKKSFYLEVVSELINEIKYHAEERDNKLFISAYLHKTEDVPITILTLDYDTYHTYCYYVYYYGWDKGCIDNLWADMYEDFADACLAADQCVKGCKQLRELDRTNYDYISGLKEGECIAIVRNNDGEDLYSTKVCCQEDKNDNTYAFEPLF